MDNTFFSQLERRAQAQGLKQVEFCGFMPLSDVLAQLRSARLLIMPSLWYETFGRTIMEAYALGTPAIVSNLGAMADLVEPDVTGWRFEPGKATELAQVVRLAWQDLARCQRWSYAARDRFLQQFSASSAAVTHNCRREDEPYQNEHGAIIFENSNPTHLLIEQ